MKFRYTRYGDIVRPVIPIRVRNGEQSIQYEVLVDSGADQCFFSAEIGDAVGVDVRRGSMKEVFGIGGKASFYYVHKVTIEVGGWPFEIEVGFMPEVAVRILPYDVVGQKGFFGKFIVKFDLLKEEVELKERK